MQTILISAFPGTGKSFYFNNTDLKVLDSDSSKFDKKDFPNNYIEHIRENIGKVDVILISSHKEVREALVKNNFNFFLVYPNINLKDEYVKRYTKRESPTTFINFISNNWDNFLNELKAQKYCKHIVLQSDEYIRDIMCTVFELA